MSQTFSISVDILDKATPDLALFVRQLTDKSGLNEAVGQAGKIAVRDHLIEIAESRHATAQRLGAQPSGHWAQAAEKTSYRVDPDGALITVSHPGISRAMRDLTIVPTGGRKYLTIPVAPEAYNVRAYRMPGLFCLRTGMGLWLYQRTPGTGIRAPIKPMYHLVKSVRQKQDRTLLPSEDELRVSALKGARLYVDYLISRGAN